MLTASQRAEYKDQGYTIVKGLYDPSELNRVLSDFNGIVTANLLRLGISSNTISNSLYENLQSLLALNTDVYLSCLKHAAKLISLQKVTCNNNIQTLSAQLDLEHITTPTSPVVHVSSEKLKIPNGYFGVGEHQDWTSIQGGIKSVVVWTPFMDVDEHNFPLEIIPGSHLNGVMSGKIEANTYTVNKTLFNEQDFVRVPVEFGDAIIMSVFTLHRTAINNSKGFRLACSMRYEDSLEQEFMARGYPCAYQRTINREFITPNYPLEGSVRRYFKT